MTTDLAAGRRALEEGELEAAERHLQAWLQQHPNDADGWERLAIVRARRGDPQGAESLLHQALQRQPRHRLALTNLGALLQRLGRSREARPWLEQATRLHPDQADGWANLAVVLREAGEPEAAAAAAAQRALQHRPDHDLALEVLLNLGHSFFAQGHKLAALAAYASCVAGRPHWSEALTIQALLLRSLGRLDAAEAALRQALQAEPTAAVLTPLAAVLRDQGRCREAITLCDQALALSPDHAAARLERGLNRLLSSNHQQGWDDYEARLSLREALPLQRLRTPHWQGPVPLSEPRGTSPSPSLLLVGEQGIGDMLQFARFAPLLQERLGPVTLCVYPELVELLTLASLAATVCGPEDSEAHPGPWLPLLSICHALGQTPRELAAPVPYLRVPPQRIAAWRARLLRGRGAAPGPLIGLHWQGNPASEDDDNWGRSFPLALLEPLSRLPGLRFVSLQKGPGSEQLASCPFRSSFLEAQPEVEAAWDFLDTAAIASCCDLLISSDSGLVHLAGGLGLPVWLLLKHIPDWRWGLAGDTSPWYPSLRLFRQPAPGDWPATIAQVAAALQTWATAQRAADGSPGPASA